MLDLDHLGSIDLADLVEQGELLVRFDSKRLVTEDRLDEVVKAVGSEALVLRRGTVTGAEYQTRYFDTTDRVSYRDHAMGRRRRFKVRVRRYLDTGDAFFEIKAKMPLGQTDKTRWEIDPATAERILGSAGPLDRELTGQVRSFVAHVYGIDRPVILEPTVDMRFRRTTIFVPERRERVTIDSGLAVTDNEGRTLVANPAVHVVEVKSPTQRGQIAGALDRAGVRPISISKYCIAIAVLEGTFRANRWRIALRALFPDAMAREIDRNVA